MVCWGGGCRFWYKNCTELAIKLEAMFIEGTIDYPPVHLYDDPALQQLTALGPPIGSTELGIVEQHLQGLYVKPAEEMFEHANTLIGRKDFVMTTAYADIGHYQFSAFLGPQLDWPLVGKNRADDALLALERELEKLLVGFVYPGPVREARW